MMRRGRGRPTFNLRAQTKLQIKEWLLRNKPKGRNYEWQWLADLFHVSRKELRQIIEELTTEPIDHIRLQIKEVTYHKNGDTKTVSHVHVNPPDSAYEGYFLLAPYLKTVLEDMVSLALRGELLSKWNQRPRLPLVRTLLG